MTKEHKKEIPSGHIYKNFTYTNIVEIPELQCQLNELTHIPTGAHLIHIANDDPENVFCLSFQTLPDSSNGVAHILEHTVLCGSEKFPVKDPFFGMTHRSLNTYMNALTGSDFTCYPAASQVPKDFYNLLEVYLDAVFKPNLNEMSFWQEGHRLEFVDPSDPTSALEYKGIVFNEMKGAMASSSARLAEAMNAALFPDVTYGVNSGGDPRKIPTLTYHELCEFHKKHYHPSRCLFFFYGNMPLEGHLDFIATHILNEVKKKPPLPHLPIQPRFTAPKYLELEYPIPQDETTIDKELVAFGWLTCQILEQQDLLALSIIEIILMDTDASPLKMAFLKSGLCKHADSYIDPDINEIPFLIILKGCQSGRAKELEYLLKETLQEIISKGISPELIENAIHQLEFFRSEITGDHTPFGLALFMRSALLKQHGGRTEDGLKIHSLFHQLRLQHLENPHYLTEIIKKYLLDNPHFVCLSMSPNPKLEAKEAEEEKTLLKEIQQKLTKAETKRLLERAEQLAIFQKKQEEEELDILPTVTLNDVKKAPNDYLLTQETVGNLELYSHACFTNEIIYADLFFDLPEIAEEELSLVRLFTVLMPQMGCGGRDYKANLDYIQAHTGGARASLALNLQASNHRSFHPSFCVRGKALHRKADKLFQLLHEMVTSTDFTDVERLKEFIQKHYVSLESTLNQNAMKYAVNLSASGLTIASKIANNWYGLDYFWKIKELAQQFNSHASTLIEKLCALQARLMGVKNPHLVVTCNEVMHEELRRNRFYGLQEIKTHSLTPWKGNFSLTPIKNQGRLISSPIAFTSLCFQTVSFTHPDSPALSVVAPLFANLVLHKQIREQGGAYGGGAANNPMAGNFYFYSYRDPNIFNTLKAFEESVKSVLDGEFDDSDLEEAKLEVIQELDAPVSPGSRGELAYEWLRNGKTLEIRQAFRNQLLSLTMEEIIKVVKKHIVDKMEKGTLISFAGRELLEKENELFRANNTRPLQIESI